MGLFFRPLLSCIPPLLASSFWRGLWLFFFYFHNLISNSLAGNAFECWHSKDDQRIVADPSSPLSSSIMLKSSMAREMSFSLNAKALELLAFLILFVWDLFLYLILFFVSFVFSVLFSVFFFVVF